MTTLTINICAENDDKAIAASEARRGEDHKQ